MIPPREESGSRSRPVVTGVLVATNVLVFAAVAGGDPERAVAWIERFGLVPRVFLASLDGAPQSAWLTPLTAMFLHGGPLHLAGNAFYLWIFGRAVEGLLGTQRFAVFYLTCGLVAALVQVAASPASYLPAIGASGAVSGLLGAYAVSYPAGRLRLPWPPIAVPAIALLFLWIALQIASGVTAGREAEGVAWWAHVGGFAAGAALAQSMWVRRATRSRQRI